jgi:hypothetical protein
MAVDLNELCIFRKSEFDSGQGRVTDFSLRHLVQTGSALSPRRPYLLGTGGSLLGDEATGA